MKTLKILGKIVTVGTIVGGVAGVISYSKKRIGSSKENEKRYKSYYQLTNQWLHNYNDGRKIETYFKDNDIKSIAIYGMGTLGELLIDELKNTDIIIEYCVDKNAEEIYFTANDISVVGIDNIVDQKSVDAMIITPIADFGKIMEDLEEIDEEIKTISLEDIIYSI